MADQQKPTTVKLPPGVDIAVARETSAAGPSGLIEQGMAFTVELPSGTTTTVWVSYRQMANTNAVAEQIAKRVREIEAIEALSTDT